MTSLIKTTFAFIAALTLTQSSIAQSYTSYFTGNSTDTITSPLGGICLMGGATEDDEAMKWFLHKANGGDVLVLRASGSDGYNDYLYSELGVDVNSVETIVCNSADASVDVYVLDKIAKAEAIWFAGGDQWDYVSYWRDTEVADLVNEGINERGIVIGGTSAGMAIQGSYYFSAQAGTITSSAALANPFANQIIVDSDPFLANAHLENVVTDTHYDDPDRRGRHMVFLARMVFDDGIQAKGIACDEYTAVCIEPSGIAHVYGEYPGSDDNAYFLQANCGLTDFSPELCEQNSPLDWDLAGLAVKVYAVKGTSDGSNTFDLNDWQTGVGGSWEHWSVDEGTLVTQAGTIADCSTSIEIVESTVENVKIYPNPTTNFVVVEFNNPERDSCQIEIKDTQNRVVQVLSNVTSDRCTINTSKLAAGHHSIFLTQAGKTSYLGSFIVR